ncbi:AAA+ superfamily predicted ATPase [Kibdelosporangium banguiense]|uniref:AAA+ superfamily predicted ATPase n=1 Tax=Kibdelosporangium banguiense TaxID=1365924 RepID=A0ABS4TRK6_9PSEU|nr:ATP-binding protein [Kibdelosporangium banguiense]MBP2326543.1 AAA+ superfamily predicted ATPase [Kibdelosporangium banguiense]
MTSSTVITDLPYEDGFAHIADHLLALDRLIERQVVAQRREHKQRRGLDARNHVLVSDDEVDRLLGTSPSDILMRPTGDGHPIDTEILGRAGASLIAGVRLPLDDLVRVFQLSPFELWTVVICLAPEVDRKYDRLYAYLQDDITRRRPSIDLVISLLCDSPAERWRARAHLSPEAPLRASRILHVADDTTSPSGSSDLARFLRLDGRIRCYLQEQESIDSTVSDAVRVLHPTGDLGQVLVEPDVKSHVRAQVMRHFTEERNGLRLVLGLHGPAGVGRRQIAEGICAELGCSLTYVNTRRWAGREQDVPALLRLAFRECLLHQGMAYVDGLDSLAGEHEAENILAAVGRAAIESSTVTFLGTEKPMRFDTAQPQILFHSVEVTRPGLSLRQTTWQRALAHTASEVDPGWPRALGAQFILTPRQIFAATQDARLATEAHGQELRLGDLQAACRRQSQHHLGDLATKISPRRSWPDLTLPDTQLDLLKELCAQVRHHCTVFEEWEFGRVVGRSLGLSALFAGVPGTGKTMAAEVIAGELGADLFAIDLSGVVSKYVGETEKNLAKIFQAAGHSNSILLFDEADALFGKRTEVSDAHDRYANIETSYLLQKMEQYDGVVILATNLRENMDEAFTRRLRFVVEFPFPDAPSRTAIWRSHFPAAARFAADVDVDLLARQYSLSGACIRNSVLTAAFAAAQDGTAIGLSHLRHGIRREYEKIGKLWTTAEE